MFTALIMSLQYSCISLLVLVISSKNCEFLKIAWNATEIVSSAPYLSRLLKTHDTDICGLSEHWLFRDNLNFMNTICDQYCTYAQCHPDLDIELQF